MVRRASRAAIPVSLSETDLELVIALLDGCDGTDDAPLYADARRVATKLRSVLRCARRGR
jgi:hypothetical protein